jgi:ABC-2 type transport system permease protein
MIAIGGALNAERIKLTTVRSPLWSCIVAAILGIGVAALQGSLAYGAAVPPERAVIGVAVFAVPVLMILSAMTVTGEYRTGMIRTTFAATPDRSMVLVVKAVVVAVFSALFTGVLSMAAAVTARLLTDPLLGDQSSFSDSGVWRVSGALALFAALAAVLGVAVGTLLRHTAGAVALLLLWPLVVEPIVGNLPNVGDRVGPYLPFANVFLFAHVQWTFPGYVMPWGEIGSLFYFAAVVAVAFGAALAVVNRRDA